MRKSHRGCVPIENEMVPMGEQESFSGPGSAEAERARQFLGPTCCGSAEIDTGTLMPGGSGTLALCVCDIVDLGGGDIAIDAGVPAQQGQDPQPLYGSGTVIRLPAWMLAFSPRDVQFELGLDGRVTETDAGTASGDALAEEPQAVDGPGDADKRRSRAA